MFLNHPIWPCVTQVKYLSFALIQPYCCEQFFIINGGTVSTVFYLSMAVKSTVSYGAHQYLRV